MDVEGRPEEDEAGTARTTRAGRRRPCPDCGSRSVAAIHYGLPRPEILQNPGLASGEFVLGGCCVWPEMPEYHCHACGHDWRVSPPYDDMPLFSSEPTSKGGNR
jgi:hypothetical protein